MIHIIRFKYIHVKKFYTRKYKLSINLNGVTML